MKALDGVELLPDGEGVPAPVTEEAGLRIRLQHGLASAVMAQLVEHGVAPKAMIPQRKTLKQFFLELTRRQPGRSQELRQ